MTDMDHEGAPDGEAPASRWVLWSGGLVSLGLVGAMALWGYELAMRDVSGVPVIKAAEGPMRVAPEDPGGDRAAYQGLAVNEIAAVGAASGPAERVMLAPGETGLSGEDRSEVEMAPDEATPAAEVAPAPERSGDPATRDGEVVVTEVREGEIVVTGDAADGRSAAEIEPDAAGPGGDEAAEIASGSGSGPGSGATDLAVAEALRGGIGASEAAEAASETAATGATAPRPPRRPDFMRRETRDDPVPILAAADEVAVSALRADARLVQLGAFDTAEMARARWDRMAGRFGDAFDGRRRVVQPASSNGETFYRLRAEGFADLGDARRFCTTLMEQGVDCIPLELR